MNILILGLEVLIMIYYQNREHSALQQSDIFTVCKRKGVSSAPTKTSCLQTNKEKKCGWGVRNHPKQSLLLACCKQRPWSLGAETHQSMSSEENEQELRVLPAGMSCKWGIQRRKLRFLKVFRLQRLQSCNQTEGARHRCYLFCLDLFPVQT